MSSAACIVASAWAELPLRLGSIFYFVVLPILLLAGIGYAIQRKLGLDMATLRKLNFYFVIPGVIYCSVVMVRVTAAEAATVVLFALAMQAVLGAVTYLAAVARRVPRDQRSALVMTTIYNNSGNYGLPLQDLAFRAAGWGAAARTLQVFVMVTQNFTSFTIGVLLAAGGRRKQDWRANLMHIVKLPPVWALLAAVVTVQIRIALGEEAAGRAAAIFGPFWNVLIYVKDAFIAVALLTLGAQLGTFLHAARKGASAAAAEGEVPEAPRERPRSPAAGAPWRESAIRNPQSAICPGGSPPATYPVALSVFLRLLIGPAVGVALVYAMGLRGHLAEMLVISTSTPTAVNCMLLCLEFDNHPDFAAKAVLYSTVLSPVTVTLAIFLAQSGLLPA